jgi:hypothetical protein
VVDRLHAINTMADIPTGERRRLQRCADQVAVEGEGRRGGGEEEGEGGFFAEAGKHKCESEDALEERGGGGQEVEEEVEEEQEEGEGEDQARNQECVRCSACGKSVGVDTMVEHSAQCFVELAGGDDESEKIGEQHATTPAGAKQASSEDRLLLSAGVRNSNSPAPDHKAELQAKYFSAVASAQARMRQTPPRQTPPRTPSSAPSASRSQRRRSGGILARFGLDFSCAAAIPSCPAPSCSSYGGVEQTQPIDRGITQFRMPASPQLPGSASKRSAVNSSPSARR